MRRRSPPAGALARVKAMLADKERQPAGAARRRQGVSRPRRQRAARARLAGAAGALDGLVRIRHLHLCLDLGADDRRALRHGAVVGGAALHSRIHRAQAVRTCCAAFSPARAGSPSPSPPASALPAWPRCALAAPRLDDYEIVPLYLACATIPIYGLVQVQAGIAQSYDWPNLALVPFYIIRQLCITVLVGAAYFIGAPTQAVTAMLVALAATWGVTLGQMLVLDRRLKAKVPARRQAIRGQDLARHVAADLRGRRLLSAAHLRRHPHARAFSLARRGRGLLRGGAAARASSPSSISPSPAPPRTSSPSITSPATQSASPRSSPKPCAGPSGRRLPPAR